MQVGIDEKRYLLPSRPSEIRLDDASDRLHMPVQSWSPTLQKSSILLIRVDRTISKFRQPAMDQRFLFTCVHNR